MAAVVTKKPGANAALALTFPAVFSDAYAASGAPMEDAREPPLPPTDEMPGGIGLQDAYHQQKLADARAMVFAGLAARRAAERRMMTSHANYFGMPEPVLGQRRFANPSLGNQPGAIDSARRTMMGDGSPFHCVTEGMAGSGLSGGVLRSAQGQAFGRSLLQRRIKQLDAIASADATFSEPTEAVPAGAEGFPIRAQLELATLVDQLRAVSRLGPEDTLRFLTEDFAKFSRTVVRFAAVASREELEDLIDAFDGVTTVALARAGDYALDVGEDPRIPRGFRVLVLPRLTAMRAYLIGMYRGSELQPRERKTLSSSLLKSTGLTRLNTAGAMPDVMREIRRVEEMIAADPEVRRRHQRRIAARFDAPARPREEDEAEEVDAGAGAGARRFARDQRQVFGARAGAFIGEAPPAVGPPPLPIPPGAQEAFARRAALLPGRRQGAVGIPVAAALREPPMPGFADAAVAAAPVGEGRFRRRLFRR